MVGGILYTEHVVKPIAESGGSEFSPIDIFNEDKAGQRVFGSRERLNILVVGIDYNYDEKGILYTKGARSDTIIVLSLSREAGFFNVVSIPRDMQVLIADDIGYDKVNSAYSYGGIQQARQTVSNFLNIPIHHHVILKVSGAKDVVDALGGLPIDVEKNMDYDDNWGKLHIHLKKGPQVLDGEQAVGYARFRMDEEGDRGRIRRQQQVIRALGRKLKEPALLGRLDELARVVQQCIDTDLKLLQMIDLANLYSSFDFAKMRSARIVGDDAVDANGISYIVPYEPENRRTVRRLLQNLDWLKKEDFRIRIFFKKAPSYLAYDLADRLYDAGFRGVQVEALAYDSEAATEETNLIWYNKVPRLLGVVQAVVGNAPSESGVVPEGRDDDLAIYIGDQEEGQWAEIPDKLLRERELEEDASSLEVERETRYQPEFTPKSLPSSDRELYEPPVDPQEELPPPSFEESLEEEYPRTDIVSEPEPVSAPPAEVEMAPPLPPAPELPLEAPLPEPVELELSPQPLATPINTDY